MLGAYFIIIVLFQPKPSRSFLREIHMTGSTNLSHLLASMSPELHKDVFVFITIKAGTPIPNIGAVMQFNEAEGLTLIAPLQAAKKSGPDL